MDAKRVARRHMVATLGYQPNPTAPSKGAWDRSGTDPVWVQEHGPLLAAALFHDVAKPSTTRCEGERITARGHARKGEGLARVELWRMGVPFAVREVVAGMVRYHQQPFFLMDKVEARREAYAISHATRCDFLSLLAESDIRGRICEDPQTVLTAIGMFRDYCDELGCLAAPHAFPSDTTRYEYFHREGRDPDYTAYEGDRFPVTLMSGLPGTGKDTWVAHNRDGWPVVSLDDMRVDMDIDPEDNQGVVIQGAIERAKVHLRARKPFVWNATNLTRRRRGALVELFERYGAVVTIVYLESSEGVLRARNRGRSGNAKVPDRVIDGMIRQWEVPLVTEAHRVEYHVTG